MQLRLIDELVRLHASRYVRQGKRISQGQRHISSYKLRQRGLACVYDWPCVWRIDILSYCVGFGHSVCMGPIHVQVYLRGLNEPCKAIDTSHIERRSDRAP